ncbi:MAG: UvrD-helicase domain-containing protein, partial [Bacteroidota bacterium]
IFHLKPSEFKIIGASAGSGKTFAVTKAYLKIILIDRNNDAFKHILAITFTNKAVGEMKERIIGTLKDFASEHILEKPHPMLKAISKETGLSREYIHQRSKGLLIHILHNYGGFEISTIDSFVHRIIRTFARDLNIPSNFEVELDQNNMLSKAVDHLISEADRNQEITTVLVDFALEKSDEDKSFDISYDLRNIAKILISEKDYPHLLQLEHKSFDDFNQWKEVLKKSIHDLDIKIKNLGSNFLILLATKNLETTDFIRGLGTYFIKPANGDGVSFDAAWQEKLENGEDLFLKKVSKAKKETIIELQKDIVCAYAKSKLLLADLWLGKALYKNLMPLSILKSLQSSLNDLKAEEQKILISEFNTLIKNEIKNQPTPYIFERLGEKIKHYFVDEFQDTSVMQWHNLLPLFDNSLSGEDGSVTIVGDAKQAIYRWRGGDASQLTDFSNGTSNPFAVPAAIDTLKYNFRSSKTIVEFNNGFFSYVSGIVFRDDKHSKIFQEATQGVKNEDEGYIDFQFYEVKSEIEKDTYYGESVRATIDDCLKRGYSYQDICVLVRKHKHGVAIASYLGLNQIPITSSEALLIRNSAKIQLLLKLLELQINPQDDLLKVTFLSDLAELKEMPNHHDFIITHQNMDINAILNAVFSNETLNWLKDRDTMPLYDLSESYVQLLGFDQSSDTFIQFFLDLVLEHTLKRDGGISSFIEYFRENEEKLSISSPENRNAVSIMTIHKAKGL